MELFNPLPGDIGVDPFPRDFSPKENVLVRLEFELAYYDVIAQYVSHFTIWIFIHSFSSSFHDAFSFPFSGVEISC